MNVKLLIAAVSLQTVASYAAGADLYCRTGGAQCLDVTHVIERGRKGRVSFVLRPDGSGCIGPSTKYLDCETGAFNPKPLDNWRPWYVSCGTQGSFGRRCTATDTYGFKISVDTQDGWRVGIGHNNYDGSPVRITSGKVKKELKNDSGWLSADQFAPTFQMLIRKAGVSVEFVEERYVKYGPKWNPASAPGPVFEEVFDYLEWAIKSKGSRSRPAPVRVADAVSKEGLSMLDCYSVQLGDELGQVLAELGAFDTMGSRFVGSDGVQTAELTWHLKDGICTATVRGSVVTKISVSDSASLDALAGRQRGK